ncbi:MAG: hypothetical protein JW820_16270 [Spirochaetales bacterium]|nr:hypothetical protein [Spirochaetales bacterium]
MAGSRRVRLLTVLLLCGLAALPVRGDELTSWFAADPRAEAYGGVRAELEELFTAARAREVPIGPLIDKLQEGAAKGADTTRLLEALRDLVERLARARFILERAGGRAAWSEEDVQAVSLLLLDGLSEELAGGLIASGLQAGQPMGAIREAAGAVTSLAAVAGLAERDAHRIGTLLLTGRLPASAYGSLVPVYLKARASGLEHEEILEGVIVATLESGGGIVSMHDRIERGRAGKSRAAERGQSGPPAGSPHGGPPGGVPPGQARDKPDKPEKPEKPDQD